MDVKVGRSAGAGGGGGAGGGAPVIADNRIPFVSRRWFSTCCGGLRISGSTEAIPYPVHAAQFALLIGQVIIPVVLSRIDSIAVAIRIIIAAVIGALWIGVTQFTSHRIRTAADTPISGSAGAAAKPKVASVIASGDEEEYGFDSDFGGFCGGESAVVCRFLLPPKANTSTLVLHCLSAALVSAAGVYYLDASAIDSRYSDNSTAAALVTAFGWITVALTLYPLLTRAPAEVSQFRYDESYGAASTSVMRTFYVAFCVLIDILDRELAYPPASLTSTNDALHIVFALLPLCWAFGVVSPPDAAVSWAIEQIEVSLFGGSHAASDLRLMYRFILSAVAVLITFAVSTVLAASDASALGVAAVSSPVIGLAAGFGFILSHNLIPGASSDAAASPTAKSAADWEFELNSSCYLRPASNSVAGAVTTRFEAIAGAVATIGLIVAGFVLHGAGVQLSNTFASLHGIKTGGTAASSVDLIWLIVLIALIVCTQFVLNVQRPLWCGVYRNRWFQHWSKNACFVWTAIPKINFTYFVIGLTRLALFVYVLIHLTPALDTLQSMVDAGITVPDPLSTAHHLLFAVCAVRAFRRVFQSTFATVWECALVALIDYASADSADWITGTAGWGGLPSAVSGFGGGFVVRLMIAGLIVSRARDFIQKVEFVSIHTISCFTNEKLKVSSPTLLAVSCGVFFPVHAFILAVSCALAVPIVPVLGLPIYVIGFPRPLRVWADFAGTGTGAVGSGDHTSSGLAFYRHMLPSVMSRVSTMMRGGVLSDVASGDVLVLRVEPFLCWVQCVESGAGYATFVVKGLELLSTSCHTAEANAIDEIIEYSCTPTAVTPSTGNGASAGGSGVRSDDSKSAADQNSCCCNPYFCHSFQPLGVAQVSMYSITKNVLTGIIDQPENLRAISTTFIRSLVVMLHQHATNGDLRTLPTKWMSPAAAGDSVASTTAIVRPNGFGTSSNSNSTSSSTSVSMSTAVSMPVMGSRAPPMGGMSGGLFGSSSYGGGSMAGGSGGYGGAGYGFSHNALSGFGSSGYGGGNNNKPTTSYTSAILAGSGGGGNGNGNGNGVSAFGASSGISSLASSSNSGGAGGIGGVSAFDLNAVRDRYPLKVYQHLSSSSKQSADEKIDESFKSLVLSCYAIVETIGAIGSNALSAEHVTQTFAGRLAHSAPGVWLKEQSALFAIVLRAYRYSVKMVYDRAVMLELDSLLSDTQIPDLLTAIRELQFGTAEDQAAAAASGDTATSGWHVGPANDKEWNDAVRRGQRSCFAIGKGDKSGSPHTSTTLQVADSNRIAIGRLNAATVRAIWSSAAIELLYVANNDDERYSIQTHPTLLRNLCVQTAEPPLGYPVFSSQPITVQS